MKQFDKARKLRNRISNPKVVNLPVIYFQTEAPVFYNARSNCSRFSQLWKFMVHCCNYEQIEFLFFVHNFCFKGVEALPLKTQSDEVPCFFTSLVFAFLFCTFCLSVCREWSPLRKRLNIWTKFGYYVFIIFLISLLSTIFLLVQSDMVLNILSCRFITDWKICQT